MTKQELNREILKMAKDRDKDLASQSPLFWSNEVKRKERLETLWYASNGGKSLMPLAVKTFINLNISMRAIAFHHITFNI